CSGLLLCPAYDASVSATSRCRGAAAHAAYHGWHPTLESDGMPRGTWRTAGEVTTMSLHHYYVVQRGDTLSGIAQAVTCRAGNYGYLAALNGLWNPNYIVPGEVIFVD